MSNTLSLWHRPAWRGGLLALLAAALFGLSTPFIQRLGSGLGAVDRRRVALRRCRGDRLLSRSRPTEKPGCVGPMGRA